MTIEAEFYRQQEIEEDRRLGVEALRADHARLRVERDELLAMLRRVEWLIGDYPKVHPEAEPWRFCPVCESLHPDDTGPTGENGTGHDENCALAVLLARAGGRSDG